MEIIKEHTKQPNLDKSTDYHNAGVVESVLDTPTGDCKSGAVIAFEGLIGVGKSTLCRQLHTIYPNQIEVYAETTNEKLLQLFYSNPQKYGFALQWGMLKTRLYQLNLAKHDAHHLRIPQRDMYLWDRSMMGDYIFALWNHLSGGISRDEMDVYEMEFGGSINDLQHIDFLKDVKLFVWMNDEPERCKWRVESQRAHASEKHIPLAYYQGIDDIHFHLFMRILQLNLCPILVQSWGMYDQAEVCKNIYQDVIEGKQDLPKVRYLNEDQHPWISTMIHHQQCHHDQSDTHQQQATHFHQQQSTTPSQKPTIFYRHADAIRQKYQEITTTTLKDPPSIADVYIAEDMMTLVDPRTKNINMDHLNHYKIKFYTNAFKRVILYHLSLHHNIYFYNSITQ